MPKQIHGHEVIEMMLSSNQVYSRDTLRQAIIEKFGAETRFHTCSAENMAAGELVDFLAQRGKFTESAGGFALNPEKVCRH